MMVEPALGQFERVKNILYGCVLIAFRIEQLFGCLNYCRLADIALAHLAHHPINTYQSLYLLYKTEQSLSIYLR